LLSRNNNLAFSTTQKTITTDFIIDILDRFSMSINICTVIAIDNARVHTSRKFKERLKEWQSRGLYIFYLPPYSPHLNIIERLWLELKQRWIAPEDYQSAQSLFYAAYLALAAVGSQLIINFRNFN
jgi:transposase